MKTERRIHFIVVLSLLKISVLAQPGPKPLFPGHLSPALQHLPVSAMGLTLAGSPRNSLPNPAPQPITAIPYHLPDPVSSDFYSRNLGFFCRQEWKVEKAVSLPLRFRLGSVTEVDHLEGKDIKPH